MGGSSQKLIKEVASRKRLASLAIWAYRALLILAMVYVVVFLLAWVSIIPSWFGEGSGAMGPLSVLAVPLLAGLIALILHRGPSTQEAAHAVDEKMGTKDLYLTAAMLEGAPGEFAPLVNKTAESEAPKVQAAAIVPFSPWERLSHVVLVLALLLVGAAFMKPFDPFGKDAEREQLAQRIKKLQEDKIAAKQRIEVLKSQDVEAKTSKPVANAEAELKKTFAQMKKDDKEANLRKLNEQQKKIGDQWRKANEKSLKSTSDQMAQRLGAKSQKNQEWKKDLNQGKSDSMKKELEEIKKIAEDMKDEKSEIKKNEMKQEMEKRIQEMNDFAKSNANSKELGDSLQQSLEQLAQSGDQQTAEEANEALQEQLKQSQQELEKMAQSIRDQKELDKMMQTIQQAQQANSKEALDGQQCQSCQNLSDYQKLFEKLGGGSGGQGQGDGQSADNGSGSSETQNNQPGQPGDGQGQANSNQPGQGGTGGLGQGRGGVTPEDPTQQNTFKSEKSKSALQAGKVLLEWKTQEEAKPGTAKLDYTNEVKKVKAGASEAILQEQIPPGYHDAIKKYFDTYDEKAGGKPAAKPADDK